MDTRLLVQANSGGGKSWLLRRLLEQSHGKVQQIVLDLEGEFATLRERFDYLLVGKEGDLPISVAIAGPLAHRLLELNVSAILDLYELKQPERIAFVKHFLEAAINAPKELWHPCFVVVDEAHVFCPEAGKSEAMGAVIDLCTRGRKRGYCAVLATQRLSKLHKDAAAECNNKLIGRTGLDVDMKRAGDELGFTSRSEILSLRGLNAGEFYAFGPAMATEMIPLHVGSVATTHPKPGSRKLLAPPPATSKVKALLARLSDLPQEAERELRTVEDYRKRIAELESELHRKSATPSPNVLERAREEGHEEGFRKGREAAQAVLEGMLRASDRQAEGFREILRVAEKHLEESVPAESLLESLSQPTENAVLPASLPSKASAVPTERARRRESGRRSPSPRRTEPTAVSPTAEIAPLRAGAMRMLKAAATFHPVSRHRMATLAGMSPRSGTFATYLSELKRRNWLVEEGGEFSVTETGRRAAGTVEALPTEPEALIEMWAGKFRRGAARMLRVLAARYPDGLTREELADASEMSASSGTFATYLSELRRNGLAEEQDNRMRATPELFPKG